MQQLELFENKQGIRPAPPAAPEFIRPSTNARPQPNKHGFFDVASVTLIAHRYRCRVRINTENLCLEVVSSRGGKVNLIGVDVGFWDPIDVIAACNIASGKKTYAVKSWQIQPSNHGGIDELRIAKVLAADGDHPYRRHTAKTMTYSPAKAASTCRPAP